MKHTYPLTTMLILCLFSALEVSAYQAPHTSEAPIIDGLVDEGIWDTAQWHNIDQLTLGASPSKTDFEGRFKVVWRESSLYVLAEITDDVLIDTHADPLDAYWEDDTFEVFIDEDMSGGNHLDNYNAFAYHIGLDNQVVDINQNGQPRLLNDHVDSAWKRSSDKPHVVIWEVRIAVYSDAFTDDQNETQATQSLVQLHSGKKMGFLVAYCDSDDQQGRQSFIGSKDIKPVKGDKNRAYIDASVFDSIVLSK